MRISLSFEVMGLKALKVLHYIFILVAVALSFREWQHIKTLEAQIPMYIEILGMQVINPDYEIVLRAKLYALAKIAPLFLGAFLTDERILMALGWLREKPRKLGGYEGLRFVTGLATAVILAIYIILLLVFELQALSF